MEQDQVCEFSLARVKAGGNMEVPERVRNQVAERQEMWAW